MEERRIEREWRDKGFPWKRMIAGSKSGYWSRHPNNDVMFNANIFTPSGIYWNGDLDITIDCVALQELCDGVGEEMIIVTEMIGWQGAEEKSYDELKENAHVLFTPNEKEYLRRVYDGIHGVKDGNMTIITSKGVDWEKKPIEK